MVVSGKEAPALNSFYEVAEDRVSNCHTIEGGSASSQLVDDGQTLPGAMGKDAFGLFHLNKECTFAFF